MQGLACDSAGRLWATEFGQDTWDELNLIRPGDNYGWPVVEGKAAPTTRFVDPVVQWHTDEASPSGIADRRRRRLRGGACRASGCGGCRSTATAPRDPKAFLAGEYGRLRTVVAVGPHTLWVTTSNLDGRGIGRDGDDRILQGVPGLASGAD